MSRKVPLRTGTFGVFRNDYKKTPCALFERAELTAEHIGDRSPSSVTIHISCMIESVQ